MNTGKKEGILDNILVVLKSHYDFLSQKNQNFNIESHDYEIYKVILH